MKFTNDTLLVNEIYANPTVQGEGPNIGKPCYFLRLAHCNLHCGFCDSQYAWNWKTHNIHSEVFQLGVRTVFYQLQQTAEHQHGPKHLVVSGGEPMLQFHALANLLEQLDRCGWTFEIETAGTIELPWDCFDQYNISPKLANSGNHINHRWKPDAIASYPFNSGKACLKFVIGDEADLAEADLMVAQLGANPKHVYLMPLGIKPEEITEGSRLLAPLAIARGYNLTTRLHILLWGAKRGI